MSRVKLAVAGAKWTLGCQIFVSLSQFVISGVTSRIFLPADFGGFAAAISLMGLLTLLTTTGFPSFLLKENHLASNQIGSIRRIALVTGVLTGVAYLGLAPLWLTLLHAPEGGQFVPLIAVAQAIGPIGGIESALLRRETNLVRDAVTVFISFMMAAGTGLLLVIWVRQAWVLAVPLAVTPLVLALSSRWLQQQDYSTGQPLNKRDLFTFGRKITLQNMGFMVLQQAPGWIVSTTLGAGSLGHFTKATSLAQMPAIALTAVQGRITQPHWRHISGRASFQNAVCDAILLSAGLTFPAFAILSANGPRIISLWLGPGWDLAGSIVSTLALGLGLSIPFTLMAGSFEMRGQFRPARIAQWCMAGAMIPPMVALVVTRDVSWAGWSVAISQASALVSLVWVVNWHSSRLRRNLVYGLLQQVVWAAVVGLTGWFAAAIVSRNSESEMLQLGVSAGVSGAIWVCTFRWHGTSVMLERRGLKLPWLLRAARA